MYHGRGKISAKMIADSVSPNGIRLSTIETCAPKFIDAEFEKHRILSSNSSSSRAIPSSRIFENGFYMPFDVRKSQAGMQGDKNVNEETFAQFLADVQGLRHHAEGVADIWDGVVHKQHINRYLDPWVLQKKVVTGTEWENFFTLRWSKDAQPEMEELAVCMKQVMNESVPTHLQSGEYHTPYVDDYSNFDRETNEFWGECDGNLSGADWYDYEDAIKCSIARCARVSYNNHDGNSPDVEKDIELYDRLLSSGHMSPFEHVATPMRYPSLLPSPNIWDLCEEGVTHMDKYKNLWSGNFKGWIQYRQLL